MSNNNVIEPQYLIIVRVIFAGDWRKTISSFQVISIIILCFCFKSNRDVVIDTTFIRGGR